MANGKNGTTPSQSQEKRVADALASARASDGHATV